MKHIYLYILLLFYATVYSQNNLHFSQFYSSPLNTNPALCGQFPNDLARFSSLSRQQWSGINDQSGYFYQTTNLSADLSLFKRHLGLGVNVLQDQAGGGIFNTINIMPTLSYTIIMGDNGLTFGAQPLISMVQFNWSLLKNPPTNVDNPNKDYFDFNFGANYKHDFYYVILNIGASGHNLLQPEQKFLTSGQAEKIPMHLKLYADVDWYLTGRLALYPAFYGAVQATSTDFLLGTNMSILLSEMGDNGMQLYLGLWGRTNFLNFESLIPTMGMAFDKVMIMTSYDYNLDLSQGGSSPYFKSLTNTFELSVIFTLKTNPKIPMPEDRFILNPRY